MRPKDAETVDDWPAKAGQRIYATDPSEAGMNYVHCVLCGGVIPLIDGDDQVVFDNDSERFVCHGPCGFRLATLRREVLQGAERHDHLYDREKKP